MPSLLLNKTVLTIIGTLLIVGGIGGCWLYLEHEISVRDKTITKLTGDNVILTKNNNTLKDNNNMLSVAVDTQNKTIDDLNNKVVIANNNFMKWKGLAMSAKYTKDELAVHDSNSTTCQDGLKLNNKISRIKYGDL